MTTTTDCPDADYTGAACYEEPALIPPASTVSVPATTSDPGGALPATGVDLAWAVYVAVVLVVVGLAAVVLRRTKPR